MCQADPRLLLDPGKWLRGCGQPKRTCHVPVAVSSALLKREALHEVLEIVAEDSFTACSLQPAQEDAAA